MQEHLLLVLTWVEARGPGLAVLGSELSIACSQMAAEKEISQETVALLLESAMSEVGINSRASVSNR